MPSQCIIGDHDGHRMRLTANRTVIGNGPHLAKSDVLQSYRSAHGSRSTQELKHDQMTRLREEMQLAFWCEVRFVVGGVE